MKASEIIARGRQLSDLQNSKIIGRGDEVGSLNEGWKDLYTLLCESNDDYFYEELIVTLTTGMSIGINKWAVPLPADFFKLRALDANINGQWETVDLFAVSQRNEIGGPIRYRFRGSNLILMGGFAGSAGQIRIGYYPTVETLSIPDLPRVAGFGKTLAQLAGITQPFYYGDVMLYLYGGNIIAENLKTFTTVTLCAAAGASFIRYYRGTLYYVTAAGAINSAATDFTAAVVPAAIVGPANVVSLEVWGDFLWYCEHPAGYVTYKKPVSGGAAVNLGAFQSANVSEYGTGYLYRDGANLVVDQALVSTGITATALTTDPAGAVYTLEGQTVRKRTLDATLATLSSYDLFTDCGALGPWWAERLPVLGYEVPAIFALSAYEDSELVYPSNILPEIISMQAAIDFLTKQKADISVVTKRRDEKIQELTRYIKRDSYQTERINQHYQQRGGFW